MGLWWFHLVDIVMQMFCCCCPTVIFCSPLSLDGSSLVWRGGGEIGKTKGLMSAFISSWPHAADATSISRLQETMFRNGFEIKRNLLGVGGGGECRDKEHYREWDDLFYRFRGVMYTARVGSKGGGGSCLHMIWHELFSFFLGGGGLLGSWKGWSQCTAIPLPHLVILIQLWLCRIKCMSPPPPPLAEQLLQYWHVIAEFCRPYANTLAPPLSTATAIGIPFPPTPTPRKKGGGGQDYPRVYGN